MGQRRRFERDICPYCREVCLLEHRFGPNSEYWICQKCGRKFIYSKSLRFNHS